MVTGKDVNNIVRINKLQKEIKDLQMKLLAAKHLNSQLKERLDNEYKDTE